MNKNKIDLSIVIPTIDEEENIERCIKKLRSSLSHKPIKYEIIVVDGNSTDNTFNKAKKNGAYAFIQKERGFGRAISEAFAKVRGEFILTLDADLSHDPTHVLDFWNERNSSDIVIGSRYIRGGNFEINIWRKLLSKFANLLFSILLIMPVKDMSGNYRLYSRSVIKTIQCEARDYDFLQEILVRAYCNGFSMKEIPISYIMRDVGKSKLSIRRFFMSYAMALKRFLLIRYAGK